MDLTKKKILNKKQIRFITTTGKLGVFISLPEPNIIRTNIIRTNTIRTNTIRTNTIRTNTIRTNISQNQYKPEPI